MNAYFLEINCVLFIYSVMVYLCGMWCTYVHVCACMHACVRIIMSACNRCVIRLNIEGGVCYDSLSIEDTHPLY